MLRSSLRTAYDNAGGLCDASLMSASRFNSSLIISILPHSAVSLNNVVPILDTAQPPSTLRLLFALNKWFRMMVLEPFICLATYIIAGMVSTGIP